MSFGVRLLLGLGIGAVVGVIAGVAYELADGKFEPLVLLGFVGAGLVLGLVTILLMALGFTARDFQ